MTQLNVLHGCRTIQLTNAGNALVSEADFPWVARFNWLRFGGKHGVYYAMSSTPIYHETGRKRISLHRYVSGALSIFKVDHKNGDGLDNRRENLRFSTHAQNMRNRRRSCGASKFKGVFSAHKRCPLRPWKAQIVVDKRSKYLGSFVTQEEAARAYDKAARELHGEYACTNADLFGDY